MLKLSKKATGGLFFLIMAIVMRINMPSVITEAWYMPQFYNLVLFGLSALLIISGVVGFKKDEKDWFIIDISMFGPSGALKTVVFMIMLLVYYFCISYIGMVSSTAVFVIIMYLYMGEKRPKTILIGLASVAIVYLIFAKGLNVRFPHGILY